MTNHDSGQPCAKPRPFLKWAGGKRQLLPELVNNLPASFGAYHEPFVGGGALFFELSAQDRVTKACLSDINPSLIDVYYALRDAVDETIAFLQQHRNEKSHYYRIRAQDPHQLGLAARAARVIYLNKTCYNGLYRENRAGQFNVPFGRHRNPAICDEVNLRAVSCRLQSVDIACRHFSAVREKASPGDFVYFDPPYHPVSATANFTSYDRNGFGEKEQVELRETLAELDRKGVQVMLSNSDTPFIRDLYAGYRIVTVYASRMVNSKPGSRGKITEVIVCNYDPTGGTLG